MVEQLRLVGQSKQATHTPIWGGVTPIKRHRSTYALRVPFVSMEGNILDLDATAELLPPVLIIVDGVDWHTVAGKKNLDKIVSLMKISRQAGVFFLVTTQSPVGLSQLTNQMSYSISLDKNSAMHLGGGGDIEFESSHEVKQAAFKSWNLLELFVFNLPQLPHPAG